MVRSKRGVVVFLVAVAACHHDGIPEPQPTAVQVAAVERASAVAGTRYSAQINPATRVELSFKVGGYVESVATARGVDGKLRLVQEGDPVQAGMQLAALSRTDYAQRLAEARAAVAQAKVALDQATLDYGRADKLAEHNAVTGAELDAARMRRDGAAASLEGARARLDQAATVLSDTVLRSPLRGTVMRRTVEVGALAEPGTAAFVIADISSVKVAFGVPDTVLPRVHLGAALRITTEAYPGETFSGRISLVAPSADPRSRVFEIDVTIPNADGRLKPGAVAALSLDDDASAAAASSTPPLVPLSAIVRSPGHAGQFAVFVVDTASGHPVAHARDVEIGDDFGRLIPIKRGLSGNETVVVQGAGLLSDGEPVEVIR